MAQANEPVVLTEEEKYRIAVQTEQELARFSRKYTILDRDRNQFLKGGGGGILAKHNKVLGILKKEQTNIKTDLVVASAKEKILEDKKRSIKLSQLLREYDQFGYNIKIESRELHEIEDQISAVKHKILDLAAQQISESKFQERVLRGEKTLEKLENKLEVQIRKFCAICAENRNFRSELEHLLIERTSFNRTWNQLIKNLCVGKKIMLDLIEQATLAYDQREEWVTKLQLLRTKAHNDLLLHIQEMRTLQRKKDNDSKLQEYFSIKGQKRFMKDLEEKHWEKRQARKEKLESQVEAYNEFLTNIQEFTKQEDVHEIAHCFLNQEEENFAMFKYVNDLNKQMEELSDNLFTVHEEICKQKAIHAKFDEQQSNSLKELSENVQEKSKEADEKDVQLKNIDIKLKVIMSGIGQLFKLFKCKNDPLVRMLGHNETIHQYNAILYLEIIEKNIQEALVTTYLGERLNRQKKNMKEKQRDPNAVVRQDRIPKYMEILERFCNTNPCPLCIEHEMVSDVIDELQFPLTKDEIQERIKHRQEIRETKEVVHNVSACHLPKSRQIIQKRYQ